MTTPALVTQTPDNLPAISAGQPIDFGHLTPETSISLQSAGREYRLCAKDVIRWVAPQAPISDAVKLLVVAQNLGLNPMLGEIELIDFGGKWTVSIRKNGYVKVAQRSPDYDGHESGVVIQPKDGSRPPIDAAGTITFRGWILVGGWAKVYRKGVSRPVYKRVPLQDYDRNTGTWKTNPAVMIEKVALAQAIREAFPVGETYDDAEVPATANQPVQASASVQAPPSRPAPAAQQAPQGAESLVIDAEVSEPDPDAPGPITSEQAAQLAGLVRRVNMSSAAYANMLAKRNVARVEQLNCHQAREIIDRLEEHASRAEWDPLAAKTDSPAAPTAAPTTNDAEVIDVEAVTIPETTRPGGESTTTTNSEAN